MPTYQTITVDITPGAKEKPVLNASQFDNGRPFNVALTWGGVPFTDADDFDIEIHVKKPDGNIVTAEPDSVVNEVCSFLTTEQMCACHGINECEIVLFDNDIQIGTGNFILDVEKAPDEGGIESASEIANLEHQIEVIIPEVIGDDYYNKTQTDALLANKADISDLPDMTNYYDKSQTDTLLAAKADTSSLESVAFSGDYNDLINTPVIPTQVQADYTQEDTTAIDYIKNKPDIDAMIADALLAVMPVETSGPSAVCNFNTDIATNLVNVKCTIVASGGGGTPSTPIPIVGHSELNLTRCGKNLLKNEQTQRTEYSVMIGQSSLVTYETYLVGGTPYHLQFEATGTSVVAYYKYENGDQFNISSNGNFAPTRSGYVQMWLYSADLDISSVRNFQLELGSTATAYAPYNGTTDTIALGSTVYGGWLDITTGYGEITHAYVSNLGNFPWSPVGTGTAGKSRFYCSDFANVIKKPASSSTVADLTCSGFSAITVDQTYGCINGLAVHHSNGYLYAYYEDYATYTGEQFKTAMSGIDLVYPLATPQTVQLTPTQVQAILGDNNVFCDTGDTTVKYKVSIQKYVDDQ